MEYPTDPLTNFENFDEFLTWPTIDSSGFQFDESFCLSDFFEAAPNENLWQPTSTEELQVPFADLVSPAGAPSTDSILHPPAAHDHVAHSRPPTPPGTDKKRNVSRPLSEPEWNEVLAIVLPLYLEKSFKQILAVIPELKGFAPSRKQLKTRISMWHDANLLPRKNIDKGDMDYMVSVAHNKKTLERRDILFVYYGFPVLEEKLRKHKERFGVMKDCCTRPTPPYITWTTPDVPSETAIVGSHHRHRTDDLIEKLQQIISYKLPDKSDDLSKNVALVRLLTDVPIDQFQPITSPKEPDTGDASRNARTKKRRSASIGQVVADLVQPLTSQEKLPSIAGKIWHSPSERNYIPEPENPKPVTLQALTQEIKGIYAGLTMVETKSISVMRQLMSSENQQAERQPAISQDHWQALIALQRTLLHEHHDFILATQHPVSSPAIRRLVTKYSMPARMWKHGCSTFLELSRRRLPESTEFMLAFIDLAYPIYSLLLELAPVHADCWVECLAHLARYRMVLQVSPIDREVWRGVAEGWYVLAKDKSPGRGFLSFSLSLLVRSNPLRGLSYLAQSLTCDDAYTDAQEVWQILESYSKLPDLVRTQSLMELHSLMFRRRLKESQSSTTQLLWLSNTNLYEVTPEESMHIAIINVAALFDYSKRSPMGYIFALRNHFRSKHVDGKLLLSREVNMEEDLPDELKEPHFADCDDTERCDFASRLVTTMLGTWLDSVESPNLLPHVHIILAFLSSLATATHVARERYSNAIIDTSLVFDKVPWQKLCSLLNTFLSVELRKSDIEPFPDLYERPLPEDYMLRGLIWTHEYFPSTWFHVQVDSDERSSEKITFQALRVQRILWLAKKLCAYGHLNFFDGIFTEAVHFTAESTTTTLNRLSKTYPTLVSQPSAAEASAYIASSMTTGSETSNTSDAMSSVSTHGSHVRYSSVPTELSSSHSDHIFDKSGHAKDPDHQPFVH